MPARALPAEAPGWLVDRARRLATGGSRQILGIAGAPGAGKSTLARLVVAALGPSACLVPMDGFHLAGVELERLGRAARKGASDTFDAAGYVALLRRLRDTEAATVYAPEFRREIDEPIAGALAVPGDVPLVVTEGNWLLCEDGPWAEVRPLLHEAWYVRADETQRVAALIERHVACGRSPQEARAWALGSDQRNAERVHRTRNRADLEVEL